MTNNKPRMAGILVGIFICALCLWLVLPTYLFYRAERQSDSEFDQLNESVLFEVPPPAGSVMLEKFTIGGSNTVVHGKELIVKYKMGGLTASDVIAHYQDFLLPAQWESYRTEAMDENFYRFVKGSACLDLNVYESGEYTIFIWHDLWKQSFSPPKPNMFLLDILEIGKETFSTCDFDQ